MKKMVLTVFVLSAALSFVPTAHANDPVTLEQARKAALQSVTRQLALSVKSNACTWRAKFGKSIGPGDSEAARYTRCMLKGSRMNRKLRRCLIAGGIVAGGALAGGVIGAAASRTIAGAIVGSGSAACLTQIAL